MKRLFEAILEANHQALDGDANACLHPTEFLNELPLVALTCVDPRLNAVLPQVLGIAPEQFIWLRNAGNIVTGPMSSTMRSLSLACAVKGGKEIAIIGHTDCQVAKTTTMQLIERFCALGIERHVLPDNLNDYFGIFGSERQNVIKVAEIVRSSPIIGPRIPVQGLLVDIETGRLEWVVNGYQTLGSAPSRLNELAQSAGQALNALPPVPGFQLSEIKFPEFKIGDAVSTIGSEISEMLREKSSTAPQPDAEPKVTTPPKIPLPPRLSPKMHLRRNSK